MGLSMATLCHVSVTVIDTGGNESAFSTVASAVARSDFAVGPNGPADFGSVAVGGLADQTFTVQNTGGERSRGDHRCRRR